MTERVPRRALWKEDTLENKGAGVWGPLRADLTLRLRASTSGVEKLLMARRIFFAVLEVAPGDLWEPAGVVNLTLKGC